MNKVYRCYTEKRPGFDVAASSLLNTLKTEEGIAGLKGVRIICRYDVQGIDDAVYAAAKMGVFSEPACDMVWDETVEYCGKTLCVEALPGQFDMRADSCEQCIAMITQGDRPTVKYATLYVFDGDITESDMDKIRKALINPVECREASYEKPISLEMSYVEPADVAVIEGFIDGADLTALLKQYSLAMDIDDLGFLREYFASEGRNPTVTELKMIDTYWSDHCRHTTFNTRLENIDINDEAVKNAYQAYLDVRAELGYTEKRPITLMDIATCGAKVLKRRGLLPNLDESEEINACSIKIDAVIDGKTEPWLLMFKNETHNHPTEIEPFGGAATCIGGAIRDPLSGRSWVYQAMRVTGAGDPRTPLEETLKDKLPQRTICRKAASGYSSYGNQIGLATGMVSEVYHPNYVAKRLETGAVVAAAPMENVVREVPAPGDVILLLGGRTGRDGIGGATGSSKSHDADSLLTCGAEVQKGNAPEERKLQRLFRNPKAAKLIKRCNDFGAGGVSVAIGELADGLFIDLDKVPKKYNGLDGTEIAISESQERMAVVLAPSDVAAFMEYAAAENVEVTQVAIVTEEPRLKMVWRGKMICDISREFLNNNGAPKRTGIYVPAYEKKNKSFYNENKSVEDNVKSVLTDLNVGLQNGLGNRFDSSIGAASVLMPYGGKNLLTPAQAMAAKIPVLKGETETASVMAWGFEPEYMESNPYEGAKASVYSSVAKLAATGCDISGIYFSFQEFFEKPSLKPERFGKPFAALLGALSAQMELGRPAIGGKDSMSGTFNDIDVPPTLISFAVNTMKSSDVISPEFKNAGNNIYMFVPGKDIKSHFEAFHELTKTGRVKAAWALVNGGAVEGLCKMAIGNDIGFEISCDVKALFEKNYGAIIAEVEGDAYGMLIGRTGGNEAVFGDYKLSLADIKAMLTGTLEMVYPTKAEAPGKVSAVSYTGKSIIRPAVSCAKPLAVIPVFPGTNCEFDTLRAVERAGGEGKIVLIRNLTPDYLKQSLANLRDALKSAQMLIIPGGFSGGDEPEGSGKFIQAFFRSPAIKDAVHELLYNRDGLALGICNGFQALIKLGLLPYGEIRELDHTSPTLSFNTIGRHQATYAYTRIASTKSPWLAKCNVGDVHRIAFSHGEGRFMASEEMMASLIANGQIATQYCDAFGVPSMDIDVNINGSVYAVESITSPDGRVLGKMGHSERIGTDIARNVPGNKFQPLFEGGVEYFK